MSDTPTIPRRLILAALIGAAVLVLAAGLLFWRATKTATGPDQGNLHKVTVSQTTCDPMSFELPAGRTTFEIQNASDRPIEWEILDGVMVVEERENIAPGFNSQLIADLRPGSFAITCGLLSNPRGQLTVTSSEAYEAAKKTAPPVTAFIGPLSEYKVFLVGQSNDLVDRAAELDAAIKAGDLEGAKSAWQAARLPWKRIEPVTGRMADLDATINPLPDYLEGRENDPAFSGFHRIEYGLWGQGATAGLEPVSAKLVTDVTTLKDRLRALKLAPADLAPGGAQQAERMADGQIKSGEDRWSQTDVPEVVASFEGIDRIATLMQPLTAAADAAAGKAITDSLAVTDGFLGAKPAEGQAIHPYGDIDARERAAVEGKFRAVATALRAVNPALGLE